jgi:hypothetical protein
MNDDRDVFQKIAGDVWKRQQEIIEAVILDFVYTLDRWPTQRFDFIPRPGDPDDRPAIFPAEHDCLKWHRVAVRFPAIEFEHVVFFRLA